jgi:cytoskeletal protein CcmA (bactofilin family)
MARTSPTWLPLIVLVALVALVAVPVPAGAQQFGSGPSVRVPAGETRQGDLYAAGELVEMAGRLDGDLVAAGQRIQTTGPIAGDLFAAGRSVDIRGPVGDSTRVVADQLSVDATIDGDLIAAGNQLRLFDGARITGGVLAAGSLVQLDGTVDGDVRAGAGEIIIGGTIGGSATLRADRISLAPGARIDGDLDYRARTPLSPEETARVGGTVRFDEIVDGDESSGVTWGSLLFWGWQTSAALLAGILAIALFRRLVPQLVSVIAENATVGTLLGFAAFLIVPAGAVVAMVTLVGLPVGLAAVLLFVVALYVAKLPVAVWAGAWLLARAGRPGASPYAAMALGTVALYVLFAIPYLGWLIWLVATWLGFGTMVLSGRAYLQTRGAQAVAAP